MWGALWDDGTVLESVVMVLQHIEYTKKKHFKMASFVFCEFYLNFLNGKVNVPIKSIIVSMAITKIRNGSQS